MQNDTGLRDRILLRIWRMLPSLLLVFLIVLVVTLGLWISSVSKQKAAERLEAIRKSRPPVNVVVLEVEPRPIRDTLNLPAMVEAWVDLEVLAEVRGQVVDVPVKEGEMVKKGQVIARIDSRDYRNALDSVLADYDRAKKNLARMEQLYREEIIPRDRYDEAVAAEGRLKAAVKNARLSLERTSITAPISGRINRLDAKVGLYLNGMDPVAQVLDIGRVKVNVGIPESDVDAVRGLERFDVTFDALDDRKVTGRKYFLSQSPDSFAHLYKLQVELKNPEGDILPGMFARVHIVKREVEDSLSVPLYAVITRNDSSFVVVEKDNRASVRMVETGILEGWKVQITRGLSPGERVIIVGHRSVAEGQEVNVVRSVDDAEELFK